MRLALGIFLCAALSTDGLAQSRLQDMARKLEAERAETARAEAQYTPPAVDTPDLAAVAANLRAAGVPESQIQETLQAMAQAMSGGAVSAAPAYSGSTLSQDSYSQSDIEALQADAMRDFDFGGFGGSSMGQGLGAGLKSTEDFMKPLPPEGCPAEDDPRYVEPRPGSECDPGRDIVVIRDAVARLNDYLGGEYAGRAYEFSRDCIFAGSMKMVEPLTRDDNSSLVFDAVAEARTRYWQRLFVQAKGGRSVDRVMADFDSGDTSFSRRFASGNADLLALSTTLYNRCNAVQRRIGNLTTATPIRRTDPACVPDSTGLTACTLPCVEKADELVCPLEVRQ